MATFTSVEQRMANGYLDTFPPFVPEEAPLAAASQRELYDLMLGLYRLCFDEPQLLVPALHEDDAYPNHFNKSSYGKPDLFVSMRKFTREMDALLDAMFRRGQGAPVKLSKRQKALLDRLGVSPDGPLPAAWARLASRPGMTMTKFSRCFFQEGYPYVRDVYARLLGNEAAYGKLIDWMTARGYRYYDGLDITASDDKLSMTYANPAWSGDIPRGGFEYKIRHTGISARYEAAFREPQLFGLCIPGGLKPALSAFDRMDAPVQDFVIRRTKVCDGCRYCVQTDKTGARPLALIPVRHHGETRKLCPYFPGYSYCWPRIDDALADDLIRMLDFLDALRHNE